MYGTSRGASRRHVYLSFSAVNSSGGIAASGEDFAGLFRRGRALDAAVGRRLRPSLRTGVLRRRFLAGILRSSIQAMIGLKPPKYRGVPRKTRDVTDFARLSPLMAAPVADATLSS
jgi:hypothetical protein